LTIAAGQSASVQAKFTPKTTGTSTGRDLHNQRRQNSPETVALSGTALAASYTMSLSPGSVNLEM
jgi:hypothetical protein